MLNSLRSMNGMVTSPHHLASQAGLQILQKGGTAIEAAVATAAALAVAYPHMTGIGGDGFWLVRQPDGSMLAIDACGAAAAAIPSDTYAGMSEIPRRGLLAANTVAGTVSGWQLAREHDEGELPLATLLDPAIRLAEAGVAVTPSGAAIAGEKSAELRDLPGHYAAIYEPHGRPLREGELLVQTALGRTLRRLAAAGLDDFYRGELARDIAAELSNLGGLISIDDLASHAADVVTALSCRIDGANLFNLPPPTQGVSSLEILGTFDRLGVESGEGFAHIHGLVEATKAAFRYRNAEVGDPDYMAGSAWARLGADTLEAQARMIDMVRASPWPDVAQEGDTTWFAVADARGQVVSCIQSTYFEFGSGVVLPESGITWQNRGCSFRLADGGWNALRPGRKPFHTLNPALAIFDDGRVIAYGTMGGEGQPQTQAAVFTRYARFGAGLQAAVTAPRWLLGRTWGDESETLKLESRFDPATVEALRAAGHRVELVAPFSQVMGHAGAIVRHPDGILEGATDPRSDGVVAAW